MPVTKTDFSIGETSSVGFSRLVYCVRLHVEPFHLGSRQEAQRGIILVALPKTLATFPQMYEAVLEQVRGETGPKGWARRCLD